MNATLSQIVYRNKKRNTEFCTMPKHGDSGWVCDQGSMIEMKYISDNLYKIGWITTSDFIAKTKESSKARALDYRRRGRYRNYRPIYYFVY